MTGPWIATGAVGCALAVIAGAFAAHGLEGRLDPRGMELWQTAARYLMYGSLGVLAVGLAAARTPGAAGFTAAGWALALGTLIFSSTVAILAVGGPRWLGAVTPIGGTLMIVGFLLLAWAAARS